MRKLFENGLVHPTLAGSGKQSGAAVELFDSGQVLITSNGFGAWHEAVTRNESVNPKFTMEPVLWGHDGNPTSWPSDPAWMFVFLRKDLPKEKIEEALRILNWLASPIGTEEYHVWKYGVEGTHFTQKPGEFPSLTKQGIKESSPPTYFFLSNQIEPDPEYYPGYVAAAGAFKQKWFDTLQTNPFKGIRTVDPPRMAGLREPTEAKFRDLMRGRRPLSDLAKVVQEWRDGGGEEARTFYMKVLKDNGRA